MTVRADLEGYAAALDDLALRLDVCAETVGRQLAALGTAASTLDVSWEGVLPGITSLHVNYYLDSMSPAPTVVAEVASSLRSWAKRARTLAADAPTGDEDVVDPTGRFPTMEELTEVAWKAACDGAIDDVTPALQAITELCGFHYSRASDEPYDPGQIARLRRAGLPVLELFLPPDRVPFADELWGSDRSPFDLDLARLAKDAYDYDGWYDPDRVIGDGWRRVPPWELPDGLDLDDFEDSNGFRAALYTDDNGNYVVAYAGTDVGSPRDWWADLVQGGGLTTGQYDDALSLAEQVRAAYGDDVAFTGHSLGGGLATAASMATGAPAVVFNSAGVNDEYRENLGVDADALDDQIRHYHTDADVLTFLQELTPVNDSVGTQYVIESSGNPLNDHSQAQLIEAMENDEIHVEVEPMMPTPHHQLPEPGGGPTEPPVPSPGPSPEPLPVP